MEKSERFTESCPIDAGGVVQFITGVKEQSPSFLIEFCTKEKINREKLRDAVQKALKLFRTFRVKPVLDEKSRKPVYQFNSADADVYPYDGRPHFFGRESSGYLFRVYYAEKSILLSMLHMLTDFFGANEFLKCILCFYFDIADNRPEEIKKLLAVDPDDCRDPYTLYGNMESPGFSMDKKWQNELEIPNRMLYRRCEPVKIHELIFSISDFLTISKRAESSVFPFLTLLTGRAVAKTYGGEDKLLTGAGSFNCRSMFNSRTPKCFSQTFTTVLHPREQHMSLNTQLTVQRARMDIEQEKGTITRSIALRKEQADRMLVNAEEYIMDQKSRDAERRASARRSTYFLSYLGHFTIEPALEKYIEDIRVLSTVTRVPITAIGYEWKDLLHIRTQEIGCETGIAPAILEIAEKQGIAGKMAGSFIHRFDTFPLEELYHGKAWRF